jgi:hypothetical protein
MPVQTPAPFILRRAEGPSRRTLTAAAGRVEPTPRGTVLSPSSTWEEGLGEEVARITDRANLLSLSLSAHVEERGPTAAPAQAKGAGGAP